MSVKEIPDPNIHELFSGERWNVANSITTEDANNTLAYLESEVTQRIAARENELKQRIVELESKLNRFLRGDFTQFCAYCGWESVDGTWDELQDHIHNCSKHPLGIANKRIAELERQQVAKVVKSKETAVEQYYYRVSGCKATHATDPDCICWHDKGTGPVAGREEEFTLEWRTKPNHDKHRIAELEAAHENYKSMIRDRDKRISELEAQLPKAVTPKIGTHFYFCECGCVVGYSERYCGQCGRKLNWRDA